MHTTAISKSRIRQRAKHVALLATLVMAAGCSADATSGPASNARTPKVPPSSAASRAATASTVDDLGAMRLTLPGDPDWLAADEHGIWVQRASGELTLVDPATTTVAGAVALGTTDHCQGLGASYGAVWTCLSSDVIRVDPTTLEVVARLKVKKQALQGHLVGAFDRVWVLTSDGSNLVGIDPATNKVATEFELPARCSDVTIGDQVLWLPCNVDDRVLKLDPFTGEVLLNVAVDNPTQVAVDTEVWVGTATITLRLDPMSGDVLVAADAGTSPDGGIALADGSVWVRNGNDFLAELDRRTGARIQQVTAEVTSGGDMLVLDGEIWTTAFDDQQLFRLDPSPGST